VYDPVTWAANSATTAAANRTAPAQHTLRTASIMSASCPIHSAVVAFPSRCRRLSKSPMRECGGSSSSSDENGAACEAARSWVVAARAAAMGVCFLGRGCFEQ
jgi:hypothetical protein